ncbi:heme utilization protein [Pseudomonas brassicacearum]|uniref:Heme utilization protein n=1 Tax=Pseudomonas brassicacearum TaxID=930166 RepID=A0A423HA11_9PSED|nr:heme utilization protein [Pseudomonas brassicacearum]RON09996.1 heme utilization protein [Pseudomonas brassicacearum]
MKPTMAIKPLVFAIAAVMAIAAQAGQGGDEHHHRHHVNPKDTTNAGATANATDKQTSTNNYISNEGTKNTANMTNSATGASGNVGVNVAAGDGNQQDNAAAIASGDGSFVFGSVVATAKVTQTQNNNEVYNQSTTNSANMSGSANGGSGNMGINMAAGDLNQQKNTMAIAVSGGKHATATASADQSGPGLRVDNDADRTYRVDTLSRTVSASGHESFQEASKSHSASDFTKRLNTAFATHEASSSASRSASASASAAASHAAVKANLDVNVDVDVSASRTNGWHTNSRSATFDADIDASLAASLDKSNSASNSASHSASSSASRDASGSASFAASGSESKDKSQSFSESSSFDLSNTVSWQVLTPTGWANPVTNTANLNGSVNGGSGNLGVNVAAGVGNQQSNSLSIASGCRTCL